MTATPRSAAVGHSRMPRQGRGVAKVRGEELLLLCRYRPNGVSAVSDTIAFLQALSRFPITVLNMEEHRYEDGGVKLHPDVDLDDFGGIVFHDTVTSNAADLRTMDELTSRKFRDYAGLKIMMRTEDHHDFRSVGSLIGELAFDLVFTCLPDDAVPRVYPALETGVGKPRFERMLTGYVTPTLRMLDPFAETRPIDIGYRGSVLPLSFGRIAYDQRNIGTDVKRRLARSGVVMDISSRPEDRFGGDYWYTFLSSCKATLGTEDGVSIFDLDGDLNERVARVEVEIGAPREDQDYEEAYLSRLEDLEGRIDYGQISAKHFEAAACGSLQIMYPARYSDILAAGRHYFALSKDCRNLDEAVDLVRDERRRKEMVSAVYEEVIQNRRYWIETFVERFDALVEELGRAKGILKDPEATVSTVAHHVLLLTAQEPRQDPRHGWVERFAPANVVVHQIGIRESSVFTAPIVTRSERGGLYWAIPRKIWDASSPLPWAQRLEHDRGATATLHDLAFLASMRALSDEDFYKLFSAPPNSWRLIGWRWYVQHIPNTTITLIEAARALRGVSAIIASDLYTLPAGIILKGLFGVKLLYDAHEYIPGEELHSHGFEKQFWSALESRLVSRTDHRQVVSPGLASLMSAEYGLPFDMVANAEPLTEDAPPRTRTATADQCVFIFCGLFGVGRGLDVLIDAWPDTVPSAVLHLQGPDNVYKEKLLEQAAATGLLGTRIVFPEPVVEEEIVNAMARGDVGVIPYEPVTINHRYCGPNKLSQYMAAGLPILANTTQFVDATVTEAECGRVVNFRNRQQFVDAVRGMTEDPELRLAFGRKAESYFKSHHNWQKRSEIMYQRIGEMLEGREPTCLIAHEVPKEVVVSEVPVAPEVATVEPAPPIESAEDIMLLRHTEGFDEHAPASVKLAGLRQFAPRFLRRLLSRKTVS